MVQFTGDAYSAGIEEVERDGVRLWVYGVAKTVAVCFKHRDKIGLDVALQALKGARTRSRASRDDIWRLAKICRVANVMRPLSRERWMSAVTPNVGASVRARLLNVATAQGVDFNQVLVRFALERILRRLMDSPYADHFLLEGVLRFTLLYDMPHWATSDVDLLGFGASDLDSVAQVFRDIAAVAVDDGIVFDPASVKVEEIRKETGYGGVRVKIAGDLAGARCKAQVDVGCGDSVTPAPVDSVYPVLLEEMPAPRLQAHHTCTVIASMLYAIALLGITNSHLKDRFDLLVLLERDILNTGLLAKAIKATSERRSVRVPDKLPDGVTTSVAKDALRQALWLAGVRDNELVHQPLAVIMDRLQAVLEDASDCTTG